MYIPEFWAGVVVTIVVELTLLITAVVVSYNKDKKNKR